MAIYRKRWFITWVTGATSVALFLSPVWPAIAADGPIYDPYLQPFVSTRIPVDPLPMSARRRPLRSSPAC